MLKGLFLFVKFYKFDLIKIIVMNSSPYKATLLNALVLIGLSLWGYFSVPDSSPTALIPCIFGIIFLALSPGVKKQNKVVAHIVVVLTLMIVIALIKPLMAQIEKENTIAIARVSLMMLSSAIALIIYIRSFIAARKNKD